MMRYLLIIIFLFGAQAFSQTTDSLGTQVDFTATEYAAKNMLRSSQKEQTTSDTLGQPPEVSIPPNMADSATLSADTLVFKKDSALIDTTAPVVEVAQVDSLNGNYDSYNYNAEDAIPFGTGNLTANCHVQVQDRVRDFFELDLNNCEFDKKMAVKSGCIMAVFDIEKFTMEGDSVILQVDKSIGEKMNLCNTERFYHQPSEAIGTAFLLDSTHVLTAYHNIKNLPNDRLVLVTGYEYLYYSRNLRVKLPKTDIYKIKQVKLSTSNLDFVTLQLDRPITNRTIPTYDTTGREFSGTSIFTVGYPLGMPLKTISNGRVVKSFDPNHYLVSIDAYRGNSGSPIFDIETGNIIGMLIGGDADIEKNGSCYTLKNCLVNTCNREVMIDIRKILQEVK
jgi:V8-like Glu-specific endopeptidase